MIYGADCLATWALFILRIIVSLIFEQNFMEGRVWSKYCWFGLAQLMTRMFDFGVSVLFKQVTRFESPSSNYVRLPNADLSSWVERQLNDLVTN